MISDDRIMGFVEGEGCFSVAISKCIDWRPRQKVKPNKIKKPHLFRVSPCFRITLAEGDIAILKEIKETLNLGSIQLTKREEKNKNSQNVFQFYTRSLVDCQKSREFFKRQRFYTRKGKDFELWCKCLEIVESGRHLTEEGILEICDIRDRMNFRKTKNKWPKDEIKRILQERPIHQLAYFDKEKQCLDGWLSKRQGNSLRPQKTQGEEKVN